MQRVRRGAPGSGEVEGWAVGIALPPQWRTNLHAAHRAWFPTSPPAATILGSPIALGTRSCEKQSGTCTSGQWPSDDLSGGEEKAARSRRISNISRWEQSLFRASWFRESLFEMAMAALEKTQRVPAELVVDVFSEPTAQLFKERPEGLSALLRLALMGGTEMAVPTTLHVVLDVAGQAVHSDRELALVQSERENLKLLKIARNCEPPADEDLNLLNEWTMDAAKPIIGQLGKHPVLDEYLRRLKASAVVSTPLFVAHEVVGSLQAFRSGAEPFQIPDAQVLWILSLLAENQMARTIAIQNLTKAAFTDYLTGLKSRGYFEKELEQEIRRTLRRRSSCGLLLVDLDDFKMVNDRYGHHTGDDVLRQFARVLTRDMREIDTVARFGGDEFAVILPETDAAGALFVATRLRDAVRTTNFHVPDAEQAIHLHVSLGVGLCPADSTDAQQLLRGCDLALYKAKREGKDRLQFARELSA
jgi:diguanylate cyclase (GGDEF)-like protein